MLLELEEDVEGMQNTILLMQRELKVARHDEGPGRVNGTVPLAETCRGGEVNSSFAGNEMSASIEPMDTATENDAQLRTRIADGGVASGEEPVVGCRTTPQVKGGDGESAGEQMVGHTSNGSSANNNTVNCNNVLGQQSMVTRKRTRSSVAQNNNNSNASEEGAEEVENSAVGDVEGKRNCFGSEQQQMKSAPRTRGQLLIESQERAKEVLTVVLNEKEEVDAVQKAGDQTMFPSNNNNGSNRIEGGQDDGGAGESNGSAAGAKLENGADAAMDLGVAQDNVNA